MRLEVTPQGVVIPKELLEGCREVEIRKTNGFIIIIPTTKLDPILELGKNPVICGIRNASEHHDNLTNKNNER